MLALYQLGLPFPPLECGAAISDFLPGGHETLGLHGPMLHQPDEVLGVHRRKRGFEMLDGSLHGRPNDNHLHQSRIKS